MSPSPGSINLPISVTKPPEFRHFPTGHPATRQDDRGSPRDNKRVIPDSNAGTGGRPSCLNPIKLRLNSDTSTTMKTYEKRLGRRKIYGIEQEDGTVQILADCTLHCEAVIKFSIPAAAAETYFESATRPPIQDLLPNLRDEHREILVTGTSPAEWDHMLGRPMPKTEEEFAAKYAPLGYTFD